MAKQSQGCYLRRESSVVASTAYLSTNTISFNGTDAEIGRQAGFADFVQEMAVQIVSSLSSNTGIFHIKTTDTTHCHLYEDLQDMASGADESVVLMGNAMLNVGQVVSWNGPALTAAVIDITHLQSTAKEKIISITDPGQLNMSVIYEYEASFAYLHDAMIRDMQARTLRHWEIKLTGLTTGQTGFAHFHGYVNSFNITGAVDNVLRADIGIALTSGVLFSTCAAT